MHHMRDDPGNIHAYGFQYSFCTTIMNSKHFTLLHIVLSQLLQNRLLLKFAALCHVRRGLAAPLRFKFTNSQTRSPQTFQDPPPSEPRILPYHRHTHRATPRSMSRTLCNRRPTRRVANQTLKIKPPITAQKPPPRHHSPAQKIHNRHRSHQSPKPRTNKH